MHTKVICGWVDLELDKIIELAITDDPSKEELVVKARPIRTATYKEYYDAGIEEGASPASLGKNPEHRYYFVQIMD